MNGETTTVDDTDCYEIVNTRTGLVEAGPYPPDEAMDKLAETRDKLREQTDDSPIYIPVDLKLRRYESTGTSHNQGGDSNEVA